MTEWQEGNNAQCWGTEEIEEAGEGGRSVSWITEIQSMLTLMLSGGSWERRGRGRRFRHRRREAVM